MKLVGHIAFGLFNGSICDSGLSARYLINYSKTSGKKLNKGHNSGNIFCTFGYYPPIIHSSANSSLKAVSHTVKPVLSDHSKIDKTKVLKTMVA